MRDTNKFVFILLPCLLALVPPAGAVSVYETAAEYIVAEAGDLRGYCLDFGAGSGELSLAIADSGAFTVLAAEPDAQNVLSFRKTLHDEDRYGAGITIHQASLDKLPYRDYAAALVVSGNLIESGTCSGSAAELFRMVRPDGGMAIIGQPPGCKNVLEESELRAWLDEANIEYTISNTPEKGLWAKVVRGPLPGAGEWTHMWADLGNTACSGDTRTRDAFSLLWFGEPGPRVMVDRHWEPVAPLFKNGLLFVPGFDRIVCVDAYNGARLWDLEVPNSSRIAMMRDAGYLAIDDSTLFLAVENTCLRVEPATGQIRDDLRVSTPNRDWGYIGAGEKLLWASEQLSKASYLAATTGRGAEGNQLGRGDDRFLITSTAVFCLDKATGKQIWRYENPEAVIANPTICINNDGVYFVESTNPVCVADTDGRVLMPDLTKESSEHIVKLDPHTGEVLWRKQHDLTCQHVFHMSCTRDTLVASGCTTISTNYWYHLHAFSTSDGSLLWEKDLDSTFATTDTDHGKQDKHPMIIGDAVQLKQGNFNLRTGEPLGLTFATTNCADGAASMNHIFARNGGVATIISLEEGGNGKPLCSVLRPGCYISIIPAGGVIMLPAFSAGCTCSHSIQTSIAWLPQ